MKKTNPCSILKRDFAKKLCDNLRSLGFVVKRSSEHKVAGMFLETIVTHFANIDSNDIILYKEVASIYKQKSRGHGSAHGKFNIVIVPSEKLNLTNSKYNPDERDIRPRENSTLFETLFAPIAETILGIEK